MRFEKLNKLNTLNREMGLAPCEKSQDARRLLDNLASSKLLTLERLAEISPVSKPTQQYNPNTGIWEKSTQPALTSRQAWLKQKCEAILAVIEEVRAEVMEVSIIELYEGTPPGYMWLNHSDEYRGALEYGEDGHIRMKK